MIDALIQLALFSAKSLIITAIILIILIAFFVLLAKSKEKIKGRLTIKNLNKKYEEISEELLMEILPKKQFKKFMKDKKHEEKSKNKDEKPQKNIFVLNFHGDVRASAVCNLREEINAILNIATPHDEVIVRIDSPGGVVHGYGLAAAQLIRIRTRNIPLIVAIDKVAASGGYLMSCIANKIIAAPFAIVGSIGVVVQLPNFHRLLKEKNIDFEQQTAGEFKRTITMFGHNTEEGREKLREEIEDIHQQFKNLIVEYRPTVDIQKVATGEHWLAQQTLALNLNLVDEIKTSDDYLLERSKEANLYEISYETKKPFLSRLSATASMLRDKLYGY